MIFNEIDEKIISQINVIFKLIRNFEMKSSELSAKKLPFRKRFRGNANLKLSPSGKVEEKLTGTAESSSESTKYEDRGSSESTVGENEGKLLVQALPVTLEDIAVPSASGSGCSPTASSSGRVSSPKRELKCLYCSKKFSHKGDLNKHTRTHTKEQPFSCSECDLRFSYASNLVRHRRIHTGSKPYACKTCNKTFSRADKLQLHIKNNAICENYSLE